MKSYIHRLHGLGIFLLLPSLLFAQKALKKDDRARYAGIGYTQLGFGEVNQRLLTARQVAKLNRRIEQIRTEYGAVVIFGSMIHPPYLWGERTGVDRWSAHVRQFSAEFDKEVYNAAHYGGRGCFLTENARTAFRDVFQPDIARRKQEKAPEAGAY